MDESISSIPRCQSLLEAVAAVKVAVATECDGSFHGLTSSLSYLAGSLQRHIRECETPHGLLTTVVEHAPHLSSMVDTIRREHRTICEEVRDIRLRLAAQAPVGQEARHQISAVLDEVTDHDHREASLLIDAYNLDVGGGD